MDWFPVWLSVRVSLAATALTLLGGVPLAWLLARKVPRLKDFLGAVVVLVTATFKVTEDTPVVGTPPAPVTWKSSRAPGPSGPLTPPVPSRTTPDMVAMEI